MSAIPTLKSEYVCVCPLLLQFLPFLHHPTERQRPDHPSLTSFLPQSLSLRSRDGSRSRRRRLNRSEFSLRTRSSPSSPASPPHARFALQSRSSEIMRARSRFIARSGTTRRNVKPNGQNLAFLARCSLYTTNATLEATFLSNYLAQNKL